jgi:hypothetical protein
MLSNPFKVDNIPLLQAGYASESLLKQDICGHLDAQ